MKISTKMIISTVVLAVIFLTAYSGELKKIESNDKTEQKEKIFKSSRIPLQRGQIFSKDHPGKVIKKPGKTEQKTPQAK